MGFIKSATLMVTVFQIIIKVIEIITMMVTMDVCQRLAKPLVWEPAPSQKL